MTYDFKEIPKFVDGLEVDSDLQQVQIRIWNRKRCYAILK